MKRHDTNGRHAGVAPIAHRRSPVALRRRRPATTRPSMRDAEITERLVIRPNVPDDVGVIDALFDYDAMANNGLTREHTVGYKLGIEFGWLPVIRVMVERSSGQVVGTLFVFDRDRRADRCELGVTLGPGHRGRGYSTEALRAMADHLHSCGIRTVRSATKRANAAAQGALRRAGFVPIGVAMHTLPNGERVDCVEFAHWAPPAGTFGTRRSN
jgi:ribosomal protein S18 acetylase RimI-like enzyme